jgi:hypothetical protein
MAPELIGSGQRAFFTEEDPQAAFPGDRNIDAGADFGGDVVLAEAVACTVKLATREQADVTSFREDAERLVLGKARQLYVSAANLLRDPQPANSPLSVPAGRILPALVCGGQFPVNPLTICYISEQLAAEGLPPGGAIQPLTLLDLEELEGCQALYQRRGMTLPPGTRPPRRRPGRAGGVDRAHPAAPRSRRNLVSASVPRRRKQPSSGYMS